jgi:16S rRNA (cytosine1407-C5)-methyltransferase
MNCWQKLPEQFLERLSLFTPVEEIEKTHLSFCQQKKLSVRVNSLVTTVDIVISFLEKEGIATERVPWYTNALLLPTATANQITSLDIYQQGHLYVQSLSSMLPALILDPQEDENILDLAAAPGSKTTQIAQLMNNTGKIIANDLSRQRLYKLHAVLEQQKITNSKVLLSKGEYLWKKYPNYFDKVLVDVPCTMEGRFYSEDPLTFKDWTVKKSKKLSYIQKQLLRSAFYSTKPGGIIVYATCTLSPEENEEIIDWLCKEEGEHVTIEKVSLPHFSFHSPLKEWGNTIFHSGVTNTVRVYPSELLEGFFIAKIRRIL